MFIIQRRVLFKRMFALIKNITEGNHLPALCSTQAFIDVYHKMLKPDGTPLTDIFIEDNLHMNAKGYAIWKKEIEPYLMK